MRGVRDSTVLDGEQPGEIEHTHIAVQQASPQAYQPRRIHHFGLVPIPLGVLAGVHLQNIVVADLREHVASGPEIWAERRTVDARCR